MSKKPKSSAPQPPAAAPMQAWPGIGQLRGEIDRLFDSFEPRNWLENGIFNQNFARRGAMVSPAIDLTEKDGSYEITAELPGLDAEDVEVKLSDGMLILRGEKNEERDEERKDYHVSERRWGKFQRTIPLPGNVEQGGIEAKFAKGLLTVHLPKSSAALAEEKKIEIKAG